MSSLTEILRDDTARLAATLGLDEREARLEAQVLLCHALAAPRSYLVGHGNDPLGASQERAYRTLLERRLRGEPVAYILGSREFFGLDFATTPAVLIPRPETELLVELALARMPEQAPCTVLDLGTGSGAIAVTLAKQRPRAAITGVDRSPEALAVARENARHHGAHNLQLLESDWFSSLQSEKFDLIVSNPPYIPSADPHLSRGDLRFEPLSALASGADGLDAIRHIVAASPAHLNAGGWLLFEHGYDQGDACRNLLLAAGYESVATAPDLASIERVSYGRRKH